jgi:hypothetical protein
VLDKVFHILDVNAYHRRLKDWMEKTSRGCNEITGAQYGFLNTAEFPNENSRSGFNNTNGKITRRNAIQGVIFPAV